MFLIQIWQKLTHKEGCIYKSKLVKNVGGLYVAMKRKPNVNYKLLNYLFSNCYL
jgi:hypothetical protein